MKQCYAICENSSRNEPFNFSIHVWSKWAFQVRNVGHGSGLRKKRIIGPKMYLRVFGPRIIMWRIFLLTFVLLSSFALPMLFFQPGFILSLFFSCFCFFLLVLFLYLHTPISSRVSSVLFFWVSELDCLWSWKDSSCICLQCGGWSLIRVNERNYQAQKGTTSG